MPLAVHYLEQADAASGAGETVGGVGSGLYAGAQQAGSSLGQMAGYGGQEEKK